MLRFTLRRLLLALVVGVAVSAIAFMLLRISGDLAISLAGEDASPADVERIREQYGLNRPIIVQYAEWLWRAVRGDLGRSLFYPESVANLIMSRLPVTLSLAGAGLVIALLISLPLGIIAALKRNTWVDRGALGVAVIGQAMPNFWFGLLMIFFFGLTLGWLPISGSDTWLHFVMPAITLGWFSAPVLMRLTRGGMVEVMTSDYIRTARAKGLPARVVVLKHALRNAIIPVVALCSVQFGNMLSGSVIIETVFALQGIGYLAWEAISRRDFPVVQGILLLVALFYVALTLLADILNAWLDPRIRRG
ncbi:ABC transporter permease [Roseococcus suduntuyensis]|uniref:Peptide/nickel transport system permease protein n=1 Tax=Roseococcus suduntuyensis TaxID=455361 RepID=A0A840AI14_9PROT|nr:ABC transporter permease [Roseococcus suduntuyensis]MBB3899715.1 peptide/nickel transport system permease protein [Roseococcus suduntuyensis]